MKIVIDISEQTYNNVCVLADFDGSPILKAIKNGTPLQKGHGRLGDLDYLYKKFKANGCKDSNVYRLIKDEPTIIKGTKESKEAKDSD